MPSGARNCAAVFTHLDRRGRKISTFIARNRYSPSRMGKILVLTFTPCTENRSFITEIMAIGDKGCAHVDGLLQHPSRDVGPFLA